MSSAAARQDLIRTLLETSAYPWNPESVELVETHISWVFLAGDRVVKIKRPVAFDFVDYSDLSKRRFFCDEEFRLNRRLTENVYLGTVPITREGDCLIVDGEGHLFEWATLMRRLPQDQTLDTLLTANRAPSNLVDLLASRLIEFHRDRAARCDPTGAGSYSATIEVVTSNLDELNQFGGTHLGIVQLELISKAMRNYVEENQTVLKQRADEGWIREGHGDLRAEHIIIENDAVQVFDCVEFNQFIRCADVASDLAFLLMDLRRIGFEGLAAELLAAYRRAGIDLPENLVRFYVSHRALVRAKVDCLTLSGGLRAHPELVSETSEYLNVALRSLFNVAPALICMTGLSGTGKSTVARSIARATGAVHVSSDSVRKELAGVTGASPAEWDQGIYTGDWSQKTYRHLFDRAAEALRNGDSVVLDATFLNGDHREAAAATAESAEVDFLLVETVCDLAIARERIQVRAATGKSNSDADVAILNQQIVAAQSNPVSIPGSATHVRIDTTTEPGVWLDPLFSSLQGLNLVKSAMGQPE